MSAWAEVNDWRDERIGFRSAAKRELARKTRHIWHARMVERAWRYVTASGAVRKWAQHQLSHAHNYERLSFVALCTELGDGTVKVLDGDTSHHLTRKLDIVSCAACKAFLDRELERGALQVEERTLRFQRVGLPPMPRDDRGEKCLLCGGWREVCGHFVGGGAL